MSWFMDIQEVIRKHVSEHIKEPFVKARMPIQDCLMRCIRREICLRWSPRKAKPPFGAKVLRTQTALELKAAATSTNSVEIIELLLLYLLPLQRL